MRGAVVDTNVFVFALLGVQPHCEEALEVLKMAAPIWAPDSLRPELCNVIWQWVRSREVPLEVGSEVLEHADKLVDRYAPCDELWQRALQLACARAHPAYDTLFIALAEREGIPVVTYDNKLQQRFPTQARSARDFLPA